MGVRYSGWTNVFVHVRVYTVSIAVIVTLNDWTCHVRGHGMLCCEHALYATV